MVNPGISIKIINKIEELDSIFPVWRQLQTETNKLTPQSDPDFYMTVILNAPGVIAPLILLLENSKKKPVGLIIGRFESFTHKITIGYKSIVKIPAHRVSLMHGGNLTKDGHFSKLVFEALLQEARRIGADMIFVNGLEDNDSIYQSFIKKSIASRLMITHRIQKNWSLRIAGTVADWDAVHSKKHLSNLRSRTRKLQKSYKQKLEVRIFRQFDELDEMMNDAEEVARKTYQRGMGVGFVADTLRRIIFELAAKKGWLRSYILYIGDHPCAFQLGFEYGEVYFVQGKGYDPEFRKYGVGNILFRKILKDFCSEGKIKRWDFGIGEAAYKQYQGTDFVNQSFVHIYLPSPKGVSIALMQMIAGTAQKTLESFSKKIGILASVKTRWRKQLTP